jgi:hypothetical protein
MEGTNTFFEWFFFGLSGLGGWLIFLLIALAAVIWLIYDSLSRHLPAIGWRMGVILTALLLLPSIIFRFQADNPLSPLAPFSEVIFYIGLLGGVLPFVLAIGYYVTYHGLKGCLQGHVYDSDLGQCPVCARQVAPLPVTPPPAPPITPILSIPAAPVIYRSVGRTPVSSTVPPQPSKPKVQAWLNSPDGHTYQLFQGETTIGRSIQNDICLQGDTTIGRQHAKIIEQSGRFRMLDLGAKNFTRVNNHIVREPILLEPDDEVQFGDNTVLHFVTSHH